MKILIVGAGLAGLSVARMLELRGIDFWLMSSENIPSSSRVATGMYNPVVFRRINLSWMIRELEKVYYPFYKSLSKELAMELLTPIRFEKVIPSKDYEVLWNKRFEEEGFKKYLKPAEKGKGEVLRAGILDTELLLDRYSQKLRASGNFIDEVFDESHITPDTDRIIYKNQAYDKLVLATGPHAAASRFFGWLPFNICKGEWIKIRSTENLTSGRVINNITNVIPEANGVYKLSSTYSWSDLTWAPSSQAVETLLESFTKLYDEPFEIISRAAGLRPTVADRKPYLGEHPRIKGLYIFNGLGSKGVMLAPYFAEHLVSHMLENTELIPEVNILRHEKRYKAADERQVS